MASIAFTISPSVQSATASSRNACSSSSCELVLALAKLHSPGVSLSDSWSACRSHAILRAHTTVSIKTCGNGRSMGGSVPYGPHLAPLCQGAVEQDLAVGVQAVKGEHTEIALHADRGTAAYMSATISDP